MLIINIYHFKSFFFIYLPASPLVFCYIFAIFNISVLRIISAEKFEM